MFPLTLATVGEENIIEKVGGRSEVRAHLENIGLNVGSVVTLISVNAGNVIVKVKESSIAISAEMAQEIMV